MEDSLTAETTDKPPFDLAGKKRMYEESQTLTRDGRLKSQIDDDYYHGYQLTSAEKRVLRGRKQPENVWNFLRLAVNGTLGVIKQGQTDPRAYPRNPKDEQSADVASKTLRYIADKSKFASIKIDASKDYLVPGTCASIIEVNDDNEIVVNPIRWEEFFYDPRSRREDFSDARYMGIAKWQYADDVAREHPDQAKSIEAAVNSASLIFDDTQEDRPKDGSNVVAWVDRGRRRMMVVEMYHRELDGWHRCKFHAGGELAYDISAYQDEKGRPGNPIEAQSCYVDRENNRYGIVRDMRGPQDEINKRSSKLLHELNSRQVQESAPGAGMGDAEDVRKEASKPDGVLPSGWQIVPRQDVVTGQANLLQGAMGALERFAPNPAILGRQGENQSGRSNLIRQQAGLTEQAIIFGGVEEWELRVYRQMWNRARQYWTAPTWVRVTDDMGAPEFVGVNQPRGAPVVDPQTGQPQVDPETGQPVEGEPIIDPASGQSLLGYKNVLAELDVDIIIDTTPDTANVQQEQFQMLVELAKIGALGPNPGPMLLKASSLPNKAQVIEEMKPQADPQAQAAQAEERQLAMRGQAAKIAKDETAAGKQAAETEGQKIENMMAVQASQAGFGPPIQGPPPGF